MDWKRFYADELAGAPGRAAAMAALQRHAGGCADVQATLQRGGVASFPHVSIHDSAAPIARVVQAILALGAPRVLALGVLHGGTLPPAFRATHAAMSGPAPAAGEAFVRLGGAFIASDAVHTPFGRVEAGLLPAAAPWMRSDPALLEGEFSLDLFLALLAAAAQQRGMRPPPVARVFVSATRSPQGSFEAAAAVAAALAGCMGKGTVCVATGDIVHIGHGYSPAGQVATVPAGAAALQAWLLPQIAAMHEAALARHDFATAWTLGGQLLSDQRHMLPVLAHLLGAGAHARLLSFQLSDYAQINGQPPPCWVAAALSLFQPA